jgi:hypothetical protein
VHAERVQGICVIHQPVGPQIHRLLVSSHTACVATNGIMDGPVGQLMMKSRSRSQQILVMVPVVTQGIPSTSITYSHLRFKFPLINRADFEAESLNLQL